MSFTKAADKLCRFFAKKGDCMRKFSLGLDARRKKYETEGVDGYDWNEAQPKWPITRIMNTAFGIISVIVWVLILTRIFASGNSEYEKMILLNDKAAATYPEECREVLRINSATDENAEGGVIVQYPIYLEQAENLQLTARVNRRTIKPGSGKMGYTFILRESGGEESRFYTVSYHNSEKKFNYTFFRICFEGVKLDTDKVYTLLVYSGEFTPQDGIYPADKADFRFTVLNSDTYCNAVTPKRSAFKKMK